MTGFWLIQTLNAAQYAALLFIISAGLSVSLGLLGVVNLAHGALYMLGAYVAIRAASVAGFWVALLVAPIAVGALGWLIYRCFLIRAVQHGPMAQLLVSFGLIFIAVEAVRMVWGDVALTLDPPATLLGPVSVSGVAYPRYRLFVLALGATLAGLLWLVVRYTSLGATLRAAVENPSMARAIGIRTGVLFPAVFTLGAALAGLGGAIAAPIVSASPAMAVDALIPALIVTVIGGVGSVPGTIAGAVLVACLDVYGTALAPDFAAVLIYIALALTLILRPAGLFGIRSAE